MDYKIFLLLVVLGYSAIGQEPKIEWDPDYQITINDFRASQTKIDKSVTSVYVQSGINIEFAVQMNNFVFMLTKNFNSKLACTFQKEAATLMAPDSVKANQLIKLVQFDFDLSELYTRKIRKELFENKKTFSDVTFFQPYFDKMIAERNTASAKIYSATDFGNNGALLKKEHDAVKKEILLLSDYCKECKPPKKERK
ncbi:hypothetical protein HZY62_18575 [Maribacter polysiphoniae]|uniref:Uncharacterized protein n=1 Tax=Maribacter polysiphoniae TaxID=429344 RepID=A0A316EDY9_9FLAO|nr:hypothetical protein [Maribacter polysiphoniae]MBD1262608.1 hypothetical protein [Maribacter polysiphoniae]PWK21190.1 hypothetical protein LX92_03991 [Maribacter polysiphoniae]